MAQTTQSLYNLEVEAACLALLIQYGSQVWPDFYLIDDKDWSKTNRPIWEVLVQQLNQTPPASVTPLVVSERLKAHSITVEGLEVYPYLEGLRVKFVQQVDAPAMAKELKRITVRRDLIGKTEALRADLVGKPSLSFEQMTELVQKALSSIATDYYKPETIEVMGGLIDVIEKRAAHPLTAENAGFIGPFPSINRTISTLTYPGSYIVVGARSSAGKSSLSWFYNTYLLEKYENLHILHLDAAEMPYEELCWRAVCCLSEGRVPYKSIYRGEWAKDPSQAKLVRGELWPRVKKMANRMSYKNVGSMTPDQQISFIKRYYYQHVGKGNHLIINYDYLKGLDTFNVKQSEHQAIGNFVNAQKTLITDEITASIWTSVQSNRMGVVTGKKSEDVNESEETFSLSDRILQQSTHSFTLRYKTAEEMSKEGGRFGQLRLIPLKKRQLLGDDYEEMLRPVKTESGRFVNNFVNLETTSFYYRDKGTLKEMMQVLGQTPTAAPRGSAQQTGL